MLDLSRMMLKVKQYPSMSIKNLKLYTYSSQILYLLGMGLSPASFCLYLNGSGKAHFYQEPNMDEKLKATVNFLFHGRSANT